MAYEKQTWVTGEVITAEKLNHIEEGIAGGSITTAKVTFANAATDGSGYSFFTAFQEEAVRVRLAPVTIELPLYNGMYIIEETQLYDIDTSYYPEITGSIAPGMRGLSITGDGTVTFKSKGGTSA